MNKTQGQCRRKFAQLRDKPWSHAEEDLLRDWWEYHEADTGADPAELCNKGIAHTAL